MQSSLGKRGIYMKPLRATTNTNVYGGGQKMEVLILNGTSLNS